jgi:hypothetical protein
LRLSLESSTFDLERSTFGVRRSRARGVGRARAEDTEGTEGTEFLLGTGRSPVEVGKASRLAPSKPGRLAYNVKGRRPFLRSSDHDSEKHLGASVGLEELIESEC